LSARRWWRGSTADASPPTAAVHARTHLKKAQAPDPRDIFAPLTFPDPAGPTRSVSGIPGPAYWQNRADYTIANQGGIIRLGSTASFRT
jgi:hypothetical protein